MPTYAIGDVQGCYGSLRALLRAVSFRADRDELWFAGDLVNRGPRSLEVLRFVSGLGDGAQVVLGNHDLHLIECHDGLRSPKSHDTLQEVLAAPDREALVDWLRHRPLLHHCAERAVTMVHAGIPPQWDLEQALGYAREASVWVASGASVGLAPPPPLGTSPRWREELRGRGRVELLLAYFTRMRVCDAQGRLCLRFKGALQDVPEGQQAWFAHSHRCTAAERILFGHWAALRGCIDEPNLQGLDTGCAWGDRLTALRLEDWTRTSVSCRDE